MERKLIYVLCVGIERWGEWVNFVTDCSIESLIELLLLLPLRSAVNVLVKKVKKINRPIYNIG